MPYEEPWRCGDLARVGDGSGGGLPCGPAVAVARRGADRRAGCGPHLLARCSSGTRPVDGRTRPGNQADPGPPSWLRRPRLRPDDSRDPWERMAPRASGPRPPSRGAGSWSRSSTTYRRPTCTCMLNPGRCSGSVHRELSCLLPRRAWSAGDFFLCLLAVVIARLENLDFCLVGPVDEAVLVVDAPRPIPG